MKLSQAVFILFSLFSVASAAACGETTYGKIDYDGNATCDCSAGTGTATCTDGTHDTCGSDADGNSECTDFVMTDSMDMGWTLMSGVLVFFMQAGFAMLEAGSVRAKNFQVVVMKNVMDASIGAISWYVIGYGLAFGTLQGDGTNSWIGTDHYFVSEEIMAFDDEKAQDSSWYFWFFQFTFCATAATIVGGAVAERCKLEGYLAFTCFLCSIVYPLVVHWTWGGGWLSQQGYNDFAGSGVVHMVGGMTALFAAAILGPRNGRFDPNVDQNEFKPCSRVFVALGTFILWFGWYGFNAGSTCAMSGMAAQDAARCATTTTLAAAAGGVASFAIGSSKGNGYDMVGYANGILGGLVSITAGCATTDVGMSVLVGAIGGVIYQLAASLLETMNIDDPIGAFPVHGCCGIWGVLAVGLFDMGVGLTYGNDAADCLTPNLIGILAITVWCGITACPFFLALKSAGLYRVSAEEEEEGLDMELMGVSRDDIKA